MVFEEAIHEVGCNREHTARQHCNGETAEAGRATDRAASDDRGASSLNARRETSIASGWYLLAIFLFLIGCFGLHPDLRNFLLLIPWAQACAVLGKRAHDREQMAFDRHAPRFWQRHPWLDVGMWVAFVVFNVCLAVWRLFLV